MKKEGLERLTLTGPTEGKGVKGGKTSILPNVFRPMDNRAERGIRRRQTLLKATKNKKL